MARLNKEEYEILKGLDERWKWIARDKSMNLWGYLEKPSKQEWYSQWIEVNGDGIKLISPVGFSFIQWEDDEPYNIQKLIDEYESSLIKSTPWTPNPLDFNESKETEMKNIEWLRRKVLDNKFMGHTIHIDVLFELMDELDEPEVLSQKWISENIEYAYFDMLDDSGRLSSATAVIKPNKLKNLLVSKQPLPIIPKYIADWIEGCNWKLEKWKLPSTFRSDVKYKADQRLYEWANKKGNMDIFIKAILLGYEVEEEPLYRARLKVITDEFIASYLRTPSSDAEDRLKTLEIGSKYIHEDYRHLSEFTEDELKKLNIWGSDQWEIEELEE